MHTICIHCGKKIEFSEDSIGPGGKRVKCGHCGRQSTLRPDHTEIKSIIKNEAVTEKDTGIKKQSFFDMESARYDEVSVTAPGLISKGKLPEHTRRESLGTPLLRNDDGSYFEIDETDDDDETCLVTDPWNRPGIASGSRDDSDEETVISEEEALGENSRFSTRKRYLKEEETVKSSESDLQKKTHGKKPRVPAATMKKSLAEEETGKRVPKAANPSSGEDSLVSSIRNSLMEDTSPKEDILKQELDRRDRTSREDSLVSSIRNSLMEDTSPKEDILRQELDRRDRTSGEDSFVSSIRKSFLEDTGPKKESFGRMKHDNPFITMNSLPEDADPLISLVKGLDEAAGSRPDTSIPDSRKDNSDIYPLGHDPGLIRQDYSSNVMDISEQSDESSISGRGCIYRIRRLGMGVVGPFGLDTLEEMLRSGEILPGDQISRDRDPFRLPSEYPECLAILTRIEEELQDGVVRKKRRFRIRIRRSFLVKVFLLLIAASTVGALILFPEILDRIIPEIIEKLRELGATLRDSIVEHFSDVEN